jgi:hypothetical protein
MPRVVIRPASPDCEEVDAEIARLRALGLAELRARWHTVFRRRAPPHLPRHILFRVLAYQLQADHWGDLGSEARRLLDRVALSGEGEKLVTDLNRRRNALQPGTMLVREWNGTPHRVRVLAEGFAWENRTFDSLSQVAFAITGTRWNGPRFFGLRDKPAKEARA